MIMNESGIHTFCLKRKYSYSEIQNIIEQNKCFCCGKDRYALSSYYQITQYKSRGVEIQMSQTFGSRPSWLTLIVNPSSLLAGHYQPTDLFKRNMDFAGMKLFLHYILKDIGVSEPLKTFKLSRCDLTCNLYYESRAEVRKRLEIFKKSHPIPRYSVISFSSYMDFDEKSKEADKHSWTIENQSQSCAFSVYDKTYELKKRHNIKIDEHILRLELQFKRSKITRMTKAKDWYSQLIELSKQVEKQQSKFLHRLHMTYFDPVPLSELLDRINTSKYREKTKKKLRHIAKKANGCVSLAAVQKDCRIKKSDLIKLLGKFEEMETGCISFQS